jgi:mannan endo-1,4-beta-mannosidase
MTLKKFWLVPLSMMLLFPSLLWAGSPHCVSAPLFFGVALDGYPISKERLKSIEETLGVSPGIVSFFLQWPSMKTQESRDFPSKTLDVIWNTGAIPCLTWEPMSDSQGVECMVDYRDILNGSYDPYLLEFAKQAALWKRPFMMRFAHEMNVERYHWGTKKKGYGPESPYIYKRMFRYVVTIFQKAGAKNVLWVFCPNSESVPNASYDPSASWNRIENYYPGDKYVDFLGVDGYNWGTTQTRTKNGWDSHWKGFAEIFRAPFETLRQLAPDKPVLVFETASVTQGGDKGEWIKNAFETARKWKLSGLVWFQVKKENDWRINSMGKASCGHIPGATACTPHQWIRGLVK